MISGNNLFEKLTFFREPAFKDELLKHGQLITFNKGDVIVKMANMSNFYPLW